MTDPKTTNKETSEATIFQADQLAVSYHFDSDPQMSFEEVSNSDFEEAEEIVFEDSNSNLGELNFDQEISSGTPENNEEVVGGNSLIAVNLPATLCDDLLIEEIHSIPNKMGFKIGDVADMLGIKQYVLRYWESEFDVLKPKKAANNQRFYTKKDVENAYLIRKLLHRDRFSIEGARSALKGLKSFVRAEVKKEKAISNMVQKLDSIDSGIEDILVQVRKLQNLFN